MSVCTAHITGFICSKDRMVRGLTPYPKPNKRMAQVMATKRKIEEMYMMLDVLQLTGDQYSMSELLTLDQLKKVMPKHLTTSASQEMVDEVNGLISDPQLAQNYRDNLLSYTSVMQDGKFKVSQYIDAVRYVSFKLLGSSNLTAYVKAFPDKYQRWINTSVSDKDISAYVAGYNKTKLVNLIFAQTLVPSHVLNADLYQKALNVQASLMNDPDVSPKVRTDAANSLLTHLKVPEVTKIELDIGIKENSAIEELRAATLALAAQQRENIIQGSATVIGVAQSRIITKGEILEGELCQSLSSIH